ALPELCAFCPEGGAVPGRVGPRCGAEPDLATVARLLGRAIAHRTRRCRRRARRRGVDVPVDLDGLAAGAVRARNGRGPVHTASRGARLCSGWWSTPPRPVDVGRG